MEEPTFIKCKCPCGKVLGKFSALDDHGGVIIQCPKCKKAIEISNYLITNAEENPEDYNLPLEMSEV